MNLASIVCYLGFEAGEHAGPNPQEARPGMASLKKLKQSHIARKQAYIYIFAKASSVQLC